MATEDLMAKFGVKTGGGEIKVKHRQTGDESMMEETEVDDATYIRLGGGRRRHRRHSKGHKGNSWLDHVKYTMKDKKNKGKSFKQILKIAKKTYKKSQSQSGGKKRKCKTGGSTMKNYQNGGSGGNNADVAKYATPI